MVFIHVLLDTSINEASELEKLIQYRFSIERVHSS